MKINVALFITALSTAGRRHGVLPVVSAASAAAGDDGAAAAATTTTVDRPPHLRALLQNDDNRLAACSAPVQNGSCDNMFCNNCNQGQTQCTPVDGCMTNSGLSSLYSECGDASWYGVACCNAGKTKCYDPQGSIPVASMFIQSDEAEEEEVPQDSTTTTTTTDKLGDEIEEAVVPSSSTLRASSLLKGNNVFTKQDGDETEDFLELGECPTPHHDADVEAPCSLDCSSCNGKTTCTKKTPTTGFSFGKVHICCNSNGNSCSGSYEEEEILQDTGKLDASSPLRASLLKVE